jgi:DNA-binding XRE family transcriptional regulator
MKYLTESFDLTEWRKRMHWTQVQAAHELGMDKSTYCRHEYRQHDRAGSPVRTTVVILARLLEEKGKNDAS